MTVPTNTDQTFTQTNIFEDLSNFIYNVDPYRTPIVNMAKRAEAKQTYHEWDVDALAAMNQANAAVQGDNPTNIALTATGRMGNRTQIPTKTIQMSGTLQAVVAAGGTNTMAYQLAKKAKELKRDMEGIITANTAQSAGNATTASITGALQSYIFTNSVHGTGGVDPTGVVTIGSETFGNGTTARTYGTAVAVTEANVRSVLNKVYTTSGDCPPYAVVSPTNKQNISAFTGVTGTRFNRVEDEVFQTAIDEYDSDFGPVKIMPDIFLFKTGDVWFLNPEYLKLAYLRPFQTIPLAKTGDSDQKEMLCEFSLEVSNEHAHGAIFDTNG